VRWYTFGVLNQRRSQETGKKPRPLFVLSYVFVYKTRARLGCMIAALSSFRREEPDMSLHRFSGLGSAKLSEQEFASAKEKVLAYLAARKSITNRELRALTQLNYDQAVSFFNKMIAYGYVTRLGKTTATRYERPRAHN
jgi:hypothetical protein